MPFLAFVCNLLGLIAILAASLTKGKKMNRVLILLCSGNVLVSVGYLLDGTGFSAAASGFLASVQSLINYGFERRGKAVPKWLAAIYIGCFVALNLWVGGLHWYTVPAILACLFFVLGILQKNGKGYRLCALANTVLWSTYDIMTKSYNGLLTHATIFAFSLFGMLLHDRKKRTQ